MDFYLTRYLSFLIKLDMASQTLKLLEMNLDTWYKRWCDYGGSDNRYAGDYRCKIILYLIFVIKNFFWFLR